jgi:enoyl-CoA hydratase
MSTEGTVHEQMSATHKHVLVVTIDRAPINSMVMPMYQRVYEIFEGLRERPEVRCAIITGANPDVIDGVGLKPGGKNRPFIGGADTRGLASRTSDSVGERSYVSRRAYEAVRLSPVPTIAAVNGAALGAGFVIATSCDFIIASDRARFAIPEIDVGAMGGSRHARRILPDMIMRYLTMTAERVDGEFMKQHGAALEVTRPEGLMEAAFKLADKLAAKSPKLMRLRKESMGVVAELPFAAGYRVEQFYTALAVGMKDGQEASAAVAERRAPRWEDDQ